MQKIIYSGDYQFDCPTARLIDVHSKGVDKGFLTKSASMMTETIKGIRPEPGQSFLHLIAMGAGEYYGSNRNGDWFNEKEQVYTFPEPIGPKEMILGGGLMQYHPTFKSNANVYREHANKDPSKRRGTILDSAYNEVMRRVELVIKVDNDICRRDLEKIARDEQVNFSMAATLPFDRCSWCGHQATKPSEYCTHIRNLTNRIMASGHKIVMINDRPNFFDISFVLVPADRIAGTLRKIASHQEEQKLKVPLSVYLNSMDPYIVSKAAALAKLAEIEKQIESNIPGGVIGASDLASAVPQNDLPEGFMNDLCCGDNQDVLGSLGDAKIMLSLSDYLKLVMGSNFSEVKDDIPQALNSLPGIFSELAQDDNLDELMHDRQIDGTNSGVRTIKIPNGIMQEYSFGSGPMTGRVIRGTISKTIKSAARRDLARGISKRGSYLAKEYARYQLAFARGGSKLDHNMIVQSNRI